MCNGWKNKQTWLISVTIDNDVDKLSYYLQLAADAFDEVRPHRTLRRTEAARYPLADEMRDSFELSGDEDMSDLYSSLIEICLREVDWEALAAHMLEKINISDGENCWSNDDDEE